MRRIFLNKNDIHNGNLILVNKSYPFIKREAEMIDALTAIGLISGEIILEKRTATMLIQLMNVLDCTKTIVPVSGYRTSKEQEKIYNDSLRENGEKFTKKYVALPHRSEHQTGMAVDLAQRSEKIDFICPNFPYTGICQKFRQKSIKYGFIERYPKGKENVTGIAHEPWHFRYVGYPHSEIIQNNNLTLEEYIEFIKGYQYSKKHLFLNHGHQYNEVFYLDVFKSKEVEVILPEDVPYQISGNNVDGFIFTLWREKV
ncbi:UNVERIFIED_CONTAM: D-alanyl-D-alanine dipeptidase/carboxypeptidase [Acetivibrio alkalicellulosi]